MAVEPRRGCGHRKAGGLYLVGNGAGYPCDRLPIPLTICPCCSQGIKQTRGWTWIDVVSLVGGLHKNCGDAFPCPLCMMTTDLGKAGMLWIGERFYPTPADFQREAEKLGISRRISTIPREFKIGRTWVLLAHPKAATCGVCQGSGLFTVGSPARYSGSQAMPCTVCKKGKVPGIFRVFRPTAIEAIITETQSHNEEFMKGLEKRHLTPVVVPDDDKDHQGTVYDEEEEPEPTLFEEATRGDS